MRSRNQHRDTGWRPWRTRRRVSCFPSDHRRNERHIRTRCPLWPHLAGNGRPSPPQLRVTGRDRADHLRAQTWRGLPRELCEHRPDGPGPAELLRPARGRRCLRWPARRCRVSDGYATPKRAGRAYAHSDGQDRRRRLRGQRQDTSGQPAGPAIEPAPHTSGRRLLRRGLGTDVPRRVRRRATAAGRHAPVGD
jgi:hypothetical protein